MLTFSPSMHPDFSPDQHPLAGLTEPPSPEDEQKLLLYINLKLRGSKVVRSGTIGDTLSGLMGDTFGHHALEPSNPDGRDYSICHAGAQRPLHAHGFVEQFGVSRKTGYKHLARYADAGLKGLQARSHRAHCCPHRTDTEVEALILTERRLHRTWGPKKLRVVLETKHGLEAAPVCSTITGMLRRHGLSPCRRRRPGAYPALNDRLTQPTQPNQVWTIDFKGWFDLTDGQRCDPLTLCDRYTRYRLAQPNQQFTGNY